MEEASSTVCERMCLVFGSPGVGKSYLINRLNEAHNLSMFGFMPANVGNKVCEDGTLTFSVHGDFIDTPGLGSMNATYGTISDKIEDMGVSNSHFMTILVVSELNNRVTDWMDKFAGMLSRNFVQPKFVLVWTHPCGGTKFCRLDQEFAVKKMEVEKWLTDKNFGLQMAMNDDDFVRSYPVMKAAYGNLFSGLKSLNHPPISLLAKRSLLSIDFSAVIEASVVVEEMPRKKPKHEPNPSEKLMSTVQSAIDHILNTSFVQDNSFCIKIFPVDLYNELIKIRQAGPQFEKLKTLGESLLRSFVYTYLAYRCVNVVDLEQAARVMLEKGDDKALVKIFDQVCKHARLDAWPAKSELNSHAKAEFVEALFMLCMEKKEKHAAMILLKSILKTHHRDEKVASVAGSSGLPAAVKFDW